MCSFVEHCLPSSEHYILVPYLRYYRATSWRYGLLVSIFSTLVVQYRILMIKFRRLNFLEILEQNILHLISEDWW